MITRLNFLCLSILLLVSASPVLAELPANCTARYLVHEVPNDLLGPVVFVVELDLSAEELSGSSVGWRIQEARFIRPDGKFETVWVEEDVTVETSDGLWWIGHEDASSPQIAEFASPPHLVGQAACSDPGIAQLSYEFSGVGGRPPPGTLASADIYLDAFAAGPGGVDILVDEEEVELDVGAGTPTVTP